MKREAMSKASVCGESQLAKTGEVRWWRGLRFAYTGDLDATTYPSKVLSWAVLGCPGLPVLSCTGLN